MISWIDILIVAILLFFTVQGVIRGLFKSAFSILKYILSFIVAKIATPYVSSFLIANTSIATAIENYYKTKSVLPTMPTGASDTALSVTMWFSSLKLANIPKTMITFFSNIWDSCVDTVQNISQGIITGMSNSIVSLLTFIGIYIITLIILIIISKLILDSITELPVIKQFNRIGGFLLGAGKGILINMIIITIFFMIALVLQNSTIAQELSSSYLASYFYIGYLL